MQANNYPFLIVFFSFLFFTSSYAQEPTVLWEKTYGSEKHEEAHTILPTSDNHLMIIGYKQAKDRYDIDLLLMKLNLNGDLVWEQTYGSDAVENGYDAVELADGSWMVLGVLNTPANQNDIWLLKVGKNGDLLWSKTYGGQYNETPKSILITQDNHLMIAGVQEIYEPNENSFLLTQYGFLKKIDLEGNELWTEFHGSEAAELTKEAYLGNEKGEAANVAIQTQDGGFVLGGHTMTKARNGVATDAWLCKTDNKGKKIWATTFGEIGGDDILNVFEDEAANIYAIGERYNKRGGFAVSFWLLKFDANGKQLFETFYNDGNVCTNGIGIPYDQESIFIVGSSNNSERGFIRTDTISKERRRLLLSEGCDLFVKNEIEYLIDDYKITGHKRIQEDIFMIQTDRKGKLLWEKRIEGNQPDKARTLCKTADGSVYVAGYTYSKGKGMKDIIVLKLEILDLRP